MATVISSGDEEPHAHPRPDTLGTIGKYSRGKRSLIFSTELARSTPEFKLAAKQVATTPQEKQYKERLVTTYGMINLRTDGEKAIMAQKLEVRAPRGEWDIHKFIYDSSIDEFKYIF
ncbi:hypothetical protein [Flavobacterium sp. Root186]|uniref:hypothetical protein n=1 Tax=Flavobacterium sp. Root186 TaxID=1736485 RepID=UPI0006FCFB2D|nr:hypothetical protein [Flavobacterium sp. Root186]KRB57910.1 hypothetical protein ASD98_06485 [Flavobacterium sp. Root186]